MPTASRDPFSNYPPRWDVYDYYKNAVPAYVMGFSSEHGDIVRFGARYRFAKSFQGVLLDDVSARTLSAYSKLSHVMFTFGAFESFLKIQGLNNDSYDHHLSHYPTAMWLANIRTTDTGDRVMKFCRSVATPGRRVKRELDAYLSGRPASFVYLAFAMRNAFAHGHLTGQVWGSEPGIVAHCATVVTKGLFSIMETEWERLMMELDAEMDSIFDPPDAYEDWQAI